MIEHYCLKKDNIIPFDDVNETDGITSMICSHCGTMLLISFPESLLILEEI